MLAATGCSRGADNRSVLHRETEVAELEAKITALEKCLGNGQGDAYTRD